MARRFGLYWNRSGELYDVTRHGDAGQIEMCRIRNLSNGTESVQPCIDALDRHIEVGWFVPCTGADLNVAHDGVDHNARWTSYYGDHR